MAWSQVLSAGPSLLVVLFLLALFLEAVGGDGPAAVVLLGPSGAGKSETGNTLLGEQRFKVSAGLESETRKPKADVVPFEGRQWQIVDTPGYLDTSLAPAELDELLAQFADVVSDHIIALVFVVPYGRFGDAHMRAWRLSRGAFGGPSLKYTALAFTGCGDRSEEDVRSEVTRLCTGSTPPAVCTVVGQLEDQKRILAFGKLEAERRTLDRSRLFDLARSFEASNGGRGYSHADFRRTRARRQLLAKRVEAITSEEDRRLLELLYANVESGAQSDEELQHALERAEGLGETRRVVVDFEDRSLGPFYQVGTGWRQPMPVPYESMRGYATSSGSGGQLFLHTGTDSGVRLRHGDRRSGEFRTHPFFLGSGEISWEASGVGGFIALCPVDRAAEAETGTNVPNSVCLERRVGRESMELARGSLDEDELLPLRGSAVYLRIVDDKTSGWGFLALDNLEYPSVVFADMNSTEAIPAASSGTKPADPQEEKSDTPPQEEKSDIPPQEEESEIPPASAGGEPASAGGEK
jgi:hypothetical protein